MTFPVSDSAADQTIDVRMPINEDNINEGDEVFVVFMELVGAVDDSRIDFSFRNATLCRIGDNDSESYAR